MNDLLQEIAAAYHSLGLRPTRRSFYYKHKRRAFGCPLTALAIFRGAVKGNEPYLGLDTAFNPAFLWACEEFGGDYATGLMDAWDGHEKSTDDPEYVEGYELGAALAQEILPAPTSYQGKQG